MTLDTAAVIKADSLDALHWCNSYERVPKLIDLYAKFQDRRREWFAALGEEWPSCDNVGKFRRELAMILRSASPDERAAMMTAEERDVLAALPRILTVYRGCYLVNHNGLSWTLSRDIAASFPHLRRYRRGTAPLLLTGRVAKDRVVYLADRGEQEIVAPLVRVIASEQLVACNRSDHARD